MSDGGDPGRGEPSRAPPRIEPQRGGRRFLPVGAAVALLAGGGVLYAFNPSQSSFYPFCVFYRTTGLLCPGCGGLRAVHQLLHGHLLTALRCNALFVGALPLLIWWLTPWILGAWRGKAMSMPVKPVWLWAMLGALVIFLILRNLPGFGSLRPPV